MKVLIIGGGGREHALAWKIAQSKKVQHVFIAPGNAGTALVGENIDISTTKEIVNWLTNNVVDLVVIGPDNYLADGLADKVHNLGIPVFGPTKAAAEIEWSKAFAKQFMKEEGIPTAGYEIFTDIKRAKIYIKDKPFPLVIKASGLAFGKGVIISGNLREAELVLEEIMDDKIFGEAGNEVIIEEYLQGKEISVHAFCDGDSAIMFPPAQDHKRIFDNDEGPNTGGMGAIAPVPWVTGEQMKDIEQKIVIPTLNALKKRGRPFKGVLFPGIMITEGGPKVIEFNARFGDPETQVFMRVLETDLVDILFACINKNLKKQEIKWSGASACCVVCISSGYPGNYEKGKVINGLNSIENKNIKIFHAGTKLKGDEVITSGGRVLGVTATTSSLKEALAKSYKAIKSVSFEGIKYRKDIGAKSI
ncbi:MAG: phosphoribosylamine--glycine ligase [Patescibacteria group bacterium]